MARGRKKRGPKKTNTKTSQNAPTVVVGFASTIRLLLQAGSPEFDTALFVIRNFKETMRFTPRAIKGRKVDLALIQECFPELMKLEGKRGVEEAIALFRFIEAESGEWGTEIQYTTDSPDTSKTETGSGEDLPDTTAPSKRKAGRPKGSGRAGKKSGGAAKTTGNKKTWQQGSMGLKLLNAVGKGEEKLAAEVLSDALKGFGGNVPKLIAAIKTKHKLTVSYPTMLVVLKKLGVAYGSR